MFYNCTLPSAAKFNSSLSPAEIYNFIITIFLDKIMSDLSDEWSECHEDREVPGRKLEPVVRKTTAIILIVAGAALVTGAGLGVVLGGWNRSTPLIATQE